MKIDEFLVKVDNFCDPIPGISLINNLTNIFLKTVFVPQPQNLYWARLKDKTIFRCLSLCVLSFVITLLFPQNDRDNKEYMLECIRRDVSAVQNAPEKFRDDGSFMLKAMDLAVSSENKRIIFDAASERLKKFSFGFVEQAFDKIGDLGWLDGRLLRVEFVLKLFERYGVAQTFRHMREDQKTDQAYLCRISNSTNYLQVLAETPLKDNPEFVLHFLTPFHGPRAPVLGVVGDAVKNDPKFQAWLSAA